MMMSDRDVWWLHTDEWLNQGMSSRDLVQQAWYHTSLLLAMFHTCYMLTAL